MVDDFKNVSSFDRTKRIGEFKIDNQSEHVLDLINNGLSEAENFLATEYAHVSSFPTIIITGAPRTGSTYLFQLMASRMNVGYVSNLMARFYLTPLVGAWLQVKLMRDEIKQMSEFKSKHGVTEHIYEPHEFGFFWSYYLQFGRDDHQPGETDIDNDRLALLDRKLGLISSIFGRPVVYKCSIAPFILDHLLKYTSIFVVHIDREKEDVVRSILRTRRERLGSENEWWSSRPAGWRDLLAKTPEEQVSWQYDRILECVTSAGNQYPQRYHRVSYNALTDSPSAALAEVSDAYNRYSQVLI